MTKIRPLLVAFAIGTMASAALAELVVLTNAQMGRVTAGANVTNEPGNFRYGSDNTAVEMNGHEGLAEYEVANTENGFAFVANVLSTGSTATTGDQTISDGAGGVCVACANAAIAANVLSTDSTATTGDQTIRVVPLR